jgi:hypothetical protein
MRIARVQDAPVLQGWLEFVKQFISPSFTPSNTAVSTLVMETGLPSDGQSGPFIFTKN